MKHLIAISILLLACLGWCQADCATNSTESEIDSRSAYCFYYGSNQLSFSANDTFLEVTSNNVFAHATVWVNSEISASGQKLADCEPFEGKAQTCNTADEQYSFTNTDGTTMYVLVCLECHYWFGDCDIDAYHACLNAPFKQGPVSCPNCR